MPPPPSSQRADQEPTRTFEPHAQARGALNAVDVEIRAHLFLFVAIVLPVSALIFPSLLVALGLYVAAHAMAEFFPAASRLGSLAEENWPLLCWAAGAVIASAAVFLFAERWRSFAHRENQRLLPIKGDAGVRLAELVGDIWRRTSRAQRAPPDIAWFANHHVMASVSAIDGRPRLNVSSALWQRTERRDPIAVGILTHEIAHIVFRDIIVLRALEASSYAAGVILRVLICAITVVVLITGASDVGTTLHAGETLGRLALLGLGAVLALLFGVGGAILLSLAVRRYSALIVALAELRADIYASLQTAGLRQFAEALASDPGLRPTTVAELRHSLLSPSLSHFSTKERTQLLGDPRRLASPKLRYFALSLVLAVTLPANPMTPLVDGYSLHQLLTVAAVLALYVSAIAMVIVGASASQRNIAIPNINLAIFLTIAMATPLVNFGEVGYFLLSLISQFVSAEGVGREAFTFVGLWRDVVTTVFGLWRAIIEALGGAYCLLAVAITASALIVLSKFAGRRPDRPVRRGLAVAPAATAALLVVLGGYDQWRSDIYALDPLALAPSWNAVTNEMPWLRLSAPALAGLITWAGQSAFLRLIDRHVVS